MRDIRIDILYLRWMNVRVCRCIKCQMDALGFKMDVFRALMDIFGIWMYELGVLMALLGNGYM